MNVIAVIAVTVGVVVTAEAKVYGCGLGQLGYWLACGLCGARQCQCDVVMFVQLG